MAEIVQHRRNSEIMDLVLFQEKAESIPNDLDKADQQSAASHGRSELVGETAIDPICHMTVAIKTAKYKSEFEGAMYYFCCPGFKSKFEKDPASYTGEAAGQAVHPAHT